MTERIMRSGEVALWTVEQGAGYPVVLGSGGPGCCDYLAPVAEMLTDIARVIRFEQRGCGRSRGEPPYSVETCVADLELVRQAYGLERWVVGGHSWGADLALIYALAHPKRVAGLLCLAGGRMVNDREWHAAYTRNRDERGELLPDYAYPYNPHVNAEVNQSWKGYIQRPALFRELALLDVPALFVYGEHDIRPSWAVEQVAALLPRGRYAPIKGAEYSLWLTHPLELSETIRAFVAEIVE